MIKTGDLVILTRCIHPHLKRYVGSVRTVGVPCAFYAGCFDLVPPVLDDRSLEGSWHKDDMRKIEGKEGDDETLTWAGKPEKVGA